MELNKTYIKRTKDLTREYEPRCTTYIKKEIKENIKEGLVIGLCWFVIVGAVLNGFINLIIK